MNENGIERIRFDGRFVFKDGKTSRYSVAGSFRLPDPTDLSIELFWHGEGEERQRGDGALIGNKMNHVWIPNDDPTSGHLEILGLTGISTSHGKNGPISTTPEFSAIQLGIHKDIEPQDRKLHLNVRLLPSGLFSQGIFEQHYTGEIKIKKFCEDPILLNSEFGELRVEETYDYEEEEEFGNLVTKQVENSTITGEIFVPKGVSLYEVNERLRDELKTIRVALSLCYRQSVQYFQVTYIEIESGQSRTAYLRRKLPKIRKKAKGDEFINFRNLSNGGLQRIVTSIQGSPRSADLVRSINFLATSYESTLENAFFMAFSAMETVVNISIESAVNVGYTNSQWKRIRSVVRTAIDEVAKELSMDNSDLVEKIPELKRVSFRKRVALACDLLGPETSDLWPNRDFYDGIGEAASLRNGLFHAAAYSDDRAIAESLIRIQTFTERLIAKIIKWPDEELWRWRDQNLRFMNR